ncbi:hypothetical protein EUTSA_v10023861mg [Eutrema salsugineum]|uniref:NB-ARC domain-containing protein n=1 Tax=Eutrema salsugineum TaxID=72664 RepID=V4KI56_EUTSA|nr:probable disease resistance protein At1g59620 [Eutrema salsugineum]ESQ29552.1 hypothetical protein EUTSA_v10023861mg [Eutrema salsugineum]
MAETLLLFGVQKIWDLLVRESERFHGVDEQFTELKNDLNLLRSFLKDADTKKHASAFVRQCVEEIKEIVFDTEDTIETFLLKEQLGETSGIKKHMRRLAFTTEWDHRRDIASKMRGISKRISKVMSDMQSFGVQQLIIEGGVYSHPQQERQSEMRKTFPSDNESDFVGFEENVKKVVGYLVEEESIQVVSICGMGGIGKTALARQVFNHEMVKNHFDGIAWVCVSQKFTRRYVWQTILQRLSPKHDERRELNMTEDELQETLFGLLETSSSLIVLDDMWKEEDWDKIKSVFPPTKGWKVLLTSRNEGVALHADPTCITLKPECLTLEESWKFFQRIAFPKKNTIEFKVVKEMEAMGKKMIKHCGGLPLAVKVLGGLLATQHTLCEWERVSENIGYHIAGRTSFDDGNANSVHHVLSLSFEELPITLKYCFLYLAHFPEDYPIDVEKLSWYWAAEGISKPEYYDRASVQDVADVYIEELVKRNMVISERVGSPSRFKIIHLHDMMREVCLHKAREENFLHIVHGTSSADAESPFKSRRLTIHMPPKKINMEGKIKNPSLRSLIFISKGENWRPSGLFFDKLHLMRVLDLSFAKFEGGMLPSSIGKLIHLRYLSLYEAHVTHLPSSMQNLKLLLYLNLFVHKGCELSMPNILEEMGELKYLYLPRSIHDMVKMDLGNLVKLETLKNFSTKHSSVTDLQGMTRLRVLSINIEDEGCIMDTLSSSLSEMRHLENLSIISDNTLMASGFVLDCMNLKQLMLKIKIPKLPDEQQLSSHLTTITLRGCYLEEDPMQILDKLPKLKDVNLWEYSFCGRRMVCSAGGFPQLQKLKFAGLEEWEEWIVEEGSMPVLLNLEINNCKKLKGLPDGLQFVTYLMNLTSSDMGARWKKRLSEGGEDYYRVRYIPYVTF